MSAYISCPKCREETMDMDTLKCLCGYDGYPQTPVLQEVIRLCQMPGSPPPISDLGDLATYWARELRKAYEDTKKDNETLKAFATRTSNDALDLGIKLLRTQGELAKAQQDIEGLHLQCTILEEEALNG